MRIDISHRPWICAAALISLLAAGVYIPYVILSPEGPRGGSAIGLAFGIAGYLLMLYAGALALRRKYRTTRRFGKAQIWMRGHLWLGLATVPLILFHSGFAWRGPLTLTLMILFLLVIASGIFGAVLQNYLPTLTTQDVPLETIYDEIPHVRKKMLIEADNLVKSVCGSAKPVSTGRLAVAEDDDRARLREAYHRSLRPFLENPELENVEAADATRAAQLFDSLRRTISDTLLYPAIQKLEDILEEHRQLKRQMRLYRLQHVWLLLHVPVSAVLLVLAAVHAIVALRY